MTLSNFVLFILFTNKFEKHGVASYKQLTENLRLAWSKVLQKLLLDYITFLLPDALVTLNAMPWKNWK